MHEVMKSVKGFVLYVLILVAGGTVCPAALRAEPLEFIFEHYSTSDGLPNNSICDIHQDSKGYLWLGTWYGLSRFDGHSFVNYMMLPGDYSNLSHNRILSIDEDRNGYLWLLTYDYHLYRFDAKEEVFVPVPSDSASYGNDSYKVEDVLCDRDGDVWVAISDRGLLRISPDLSQTEFWNTASRLIGKHITGIYEDSKGDIYVVSETGIALIRDDSVSLLSRSSDVMDFSEYAGHLFFALPDHILAIDIDTREQKRIDASSCNAGSVTAMTLTENAGHRLFVGFEDDAVACLDTLSMTLDVHRTDMGRVRYLFPDPEGLVWIATERTGIWSYDQKKDRFRHYRHSNNVMSYYSDTLANVVSHDGRVWIKMNNYGFGYYDRQADEIIPLSNVREQDGHRFMNGVACYEIDRSGVLWMSTVGRGLERVTVISQKVEVIKPPTDSDDPRASAEIRAMLHDSKGNVWVAAKSRELYRFSPDMKTCRKFPDRHSGDIGIIYSIFEDSAGNIWLGTKGDGLVRMSEVGRDRYEWKRFRSDPGNHASLSNNNVYSVAQDKDGRIWVGTFGGGISMLSDPDSDSFITVAGNFPDYPQHLGDRVRCMHCRPDGKVLVAAVGGLIWFEPSDNPELTLFNLEQKIPGNMNSLGNNDIVHMFTDNSGTTWLSTFGGGLNRLVFNDGVPEFQVICTDHGLSSNIILSSVADDHGRIWMGTEAGLSRYDPLTGNVFNFSRYDGVPSTTYSEATCSRSSDGRVWFGTLDNVFCISPDNFMDAYLEPELTFTGLSIDGVRVPFSEQMVIPYDCSFFRIDFSSLEFGKKHELEYVYMLEGYDKDWISSAGNQSATYSRIPPGEYVFKVSYPGADSDPVSIAVDVRPSFWNSIYAILLYIIAGFVLVHLLVKLLFTQMKLRNDVRLEQDLNEIKARFFTNISHELRTPLTLILGGIDEISRKTPESDSKYYSVNMIYKNARRMMTLVNQLLDIRTIVSGKMNLKVSQFDIVKLVESIYGDFRDMSAERQMEMRIIKSVDSLMVWGDAIRIEALVYNLLSNAFKYTSDGGKIEVGILYKEGDSDYRIMVKDNGIGVPEEKSRTIFEPFIKGDSSAFRNMASNGIGLAFCKEIVDVHFGEIWVESRRDGGSKFFVRLPVDRDRFADENIQFLENNGIQPTETYGLSRYRVAPTYPKGAMKVLVVEDNAELKIYLYNSLINNYEVRDASNGTEAWGILQEGWMPDLIVTDLMMPQMDGMELVNRVRNDFNTSHIPIIMITAKHEDDTQLKAMKYGADGYIVKPFTIEILIARIENMIERRRSLISSFSSQMNSEEGPRKVVISPQEILITDRDEELIKKVMTWLEENVSDAEVTVEQLAQYVGMGRTSMYNKIKGLTGKSPVELIQDFRMEKATYYLKSGQYSVSETSYKVGFSDPGYFSRSFKKHFGMSPADYMKQNRQQE